MGQINASASSVRKLANDLNNTIKKLQAISEQVKMAGNVEGWNDNQGVQFKQVVRKIAKLTTSPVDTLQRAIPRLEKLASALDRYNSVKF